MAPTFNPKAATKVPASADLIDIILSKTQRKTPTVVHKGYAIARIRSFYIRKVKFASQSFHDRLTLILTDFPVIEELHPFYADLVNVLYDRDHYKLALGQVNQMRNLVDGIAKDYLRLLKYGDSLYRCKQLKRAALGRMCTLVKRNSSSLAYLEEVRQHMARLPSIDPTTRTLIISGFPNVGKSSFINKITRADVDVQPYAFTTKSLFVGHMDYKYLRWQVIDTPGILDHSLEERNTIEMQSITALAHLRAAVLFFVDPSEQCGYTLVQQASLFRSMAPLFAAKPLIVVANKTDLGWEDSLDEQSKQIMKGFVEKGDDDDGSGRVADLMIKTSTLEESGIMEVRNSSCDLLLTQRVESKVKSRRAQGILNRLHVATPTANGARPARPPVIPSSVLQKQRVDDDGDEMVEEAEMGDDAEMKDTRVLEKDQEVANGGPGVYSMNWRKLYKLSKDEWSYDVIPEIVDGKNIGDFVDPDIGARLAELEVEEEAQVAAIEAEEAMAPEPEVMDPEQKDMLERIRAKKALMRKIHAREKTKNKSSLTRAQVARRGLEADSFEEHLEGVGVESEDAARLAAENAGPTSRSRARALENSRKRGREEEEEPAREVSIAKTANERGLRDSRQLKQAMVIERKKSKLNFQRNSRKGAGDRSVYNDMPKHLFSGKRGAGKTDRR